MDAGRAGQIPRVASHTGFDHTTAVNQLASQPLSLQTVRAVVCAVCMHQPVTRVQAFGSLVNGVPHAGSDIDLLVEFQPNTRIGLLAMGALKEDLEERLAR